MAGALRSGLKGSPESPPSFGCFRRWKVPFFSKLVSYQGNRYGHWVALSRLNQVNGRSRLPDMASTSILTALEPIRYLLASLCAADGNLHWEAIPVLVSQGITLK